MSQKTKVIANASASWLRLSPSAVECMKDGVPCSSVKRNLYALKWIDSVLYKAVSALINYCDTEQYQKNYGEQT